jgi:tRNA U34 5-methylaminomethyl-2-thiouridine-forming methyltransferase MnmC
MQKPKLIETSDGSHSLYIRELNETYHSTHGAATESKYVFLEQGVLHFLNAQKVNELRILEVGFGTGLNALMMLDFARANSQLSVYYDTLEPYPLEESVYRTFNFANYFDHVEAKDLVEMHEQMEMNSGGFDMKKHYQKIQEILLKDAHYDIIFFDAFAPNKQPAMWDLTVFEQLNQALKVGGVLVTYCAQGQFKRNLKEAQFEVETLEGPPGKKEMVRGVKV